MAIKYTLEFHTDAAIVQKGTQSEKQALKSTLAGNIASWGGVYNESNIDQLWDKLSKVNLADVQVRKELTEFMQSERALKWGNAGPEFETRFAILQKYILAASEADQKKKDGEKQIRTETSQAIEGENANIDQATRDRAKQSVVSRESQSPDSARKLAWNTEHVKQYAQRIAAVQEKLNAGDDGKKSLAVLLKQVQDAPTEELVRAIQAQIVLLWKTVSRSGSADGWFGPLTLAALESIAGITPQSEESIPQEWTSAAPVSSPIGGRGRRTSSGDPRSPLYVPDAKPAVPSPPANSGGHGGLPDTTSPSGRPEGGLIDRERGGIATLANLSIRAILSEIREGKGVTSIRWIRSEAKAKACRALEDILSNQTLSPAGAAQEAAKILEAHGVGASDDIADLKMLASAKDEPSMRKIAIRIMRRNDGTEMMHDMFYSLNASAIDGVTLTKAESDDITNRVGIAMRRMTTELDTIAKREFEANHAAFEAAGVPNYTYYLEELRKAQTKALESRFTFQKKVQKISNPDKLVEWEQYRDAVDPLNEWFKISDEWMTRMANFVVYDLTSVLISGWIAWVAGRMALRGALHFNRWQQIAVGAGRLNSGLRWVGIVGRSAIEGTVFTAAHAGIRNQEWFMNQPDAAKTVIMNSVGFALFRTVSQASPIKVGKLFDGAKHPAIDGLLKQGLFVPAVLTAVNLGVFNIERLRSKDPDVWNDGFSEFLLNAAIGGALHYYKPAKIGASTATITGDRLNLQREVIGQNGTITLSTGKTVNFVRALDGTYTMKLGDNKVVFKPAQHFNDKIEAALAARNGTSATPAAPAGAASPATTPAPAARPTSETAAAAAPKEGGASQAMIQKMLKYDIYEGKNGFAKFFNNAVLMKPIDTPVVGAVANAVRQPLVLARELTTILASESKWTTKAGEGLKTTLLGSSHPGVVNGGLTFGIFAVWALTETRNAHKGESVSNLDVAKETFLRYFKNMYVNMPVGVISGLSIWFENQFKREPNKLQGV